MLRPLLILALNILRQVNQYRTDTVKAPKPCTLLDLKLIINFVIRMRVYLHLIKNDSITQKNV